jgi:hypothetical protein
MLLRGFIWNEPTPIRIVLLATERSQARTRTSSATATLEDVAEIGTS